jgi:hypothetical protein
VGDVRSVAIALFALAGCIDEFGGSNVQVELSPATPVQASPFVAGPAAGELPSGAHFTLYAFEDGVDDAGEPIGRLFELQRFELHRVVDVRSPCFIDVGDHVPFPGLHVTQYAAKMMEATGIDDVANPPASATDEQLVDVATALQRQRNVGALASDSGPKVVTSASAYGYGPFGATCTDAAGFPPPDCIDADSNRRRLEMCRAAWKANADLYEGTDRILTAPLNGTSFGMAAGVNPVNLAPVGGAQFFVDEALEGFAAYAIYWKQDTAPSNDLGELLLFGTATAPTRGVIRVPMTSLVSPAVTADLAIFANLYEDDVSF